MSISKHQWPVWVSYYPLEGTWDCHGVCYKLVSEPCGEAGVDPYSPDVHLPGTQPFPHTQGPLVLVPDWADLLDAAVGVGQLGAGELCVGEVVSGELKYKHDKTDMIKHD